MYDIEKCILVTNNDRAVQEFAGQFRGVILVTEYREVLVRARDLIYAGFKLISHPQASSLKPNQTPYRTLILYGVKGELDFDSVSLIEKAIETFDKWNHIRKTPIYDQKISYDYKTIDLSMIENIISRL